MKVEIKNAKTEDIPFVIEGIKEICKIEKQKPESDKSLLKTTFKAIKKKEILIVTNKNHQIGFLQFTFSKKSPYGLDYGNWDRRFAWIEWVYVSKNYRKKGIGKTLIKKLNSICKKNKIHEVLLDVFEVNKNAREFYSKSHFVRQINILSERLK